MPLTALRLALAVAIVFVIPGYLLVRALWPDPRAENAPDKVLTAFYTVILSMSITILVGVVLGFMPHGGGQGWLQTSATGAPIVEAVLILVSLGLFAAGYARGAYPWLRRTPGRTPESTPE